MKIQHINMEANNTTPVKISGKADRKAIIKRIGEIAKLLHQKQMQYTRADLAYDLRDYGVKKDSNVLDNWVYVAYQTKPFPKEVFLTNDHKHYMVDAYELHAILSVHDEEQTTQVVQKHLQDSQAKLDSTQQQASENISDELATTSSMLSTIRGTSGVEKVHHEADMVFGKYTQLVDTYHEARASVETVVADFVELRTQTQELFMTYASALVDIFGDSITVISPKLFDFSQIQWLDVDTMLGNTKLEYDHLASSCEMLFSEISASFTNTLNSASQTYRKSREKSVAVVEASMAILEHYADAAERTAKLKKELLKLKSSMRHDATIIKGDIMRTAVIYKTLNDVYIPKALWFNTYGTNTFKQQLDELTAQIYDIPKIKPLKEQRDKTITTLKSINRSIFDVQNNIDYYTKHIAESQKTLQDEKEHYNNAKRNKPTSPFFLFNLITFGALGRSYRRKLYTWSQSELPFIEAYESLQADIEVEKDDLKNSKQQLKFYQKKYDELRNELETISRSLREHLCIDKQLRTRVAVHLSDYIRLLFVAKEICESSLNNELVNTVNIEKIEDVVLPAEITQNIHSFVDTIAGNMHISSAQAADIVSLATSEVPKDGYDEEGLNVVAQQANQLVEHGAELCKQLIELRTQMLQDAHEEAYYQQELTKLQNKFQTQMQNAGNAAQSILEIAAQLNSTENPDIVKQALMDLSGSKEPYSSQDLQDFLDGKRTINI